MPDNVFKTNTVLIIDMQQKILKRTNGGITSKWKETETQVLHHKRTWFKANSLKFNNVGMFKFVHNSNFLDKSLGVFLVLHFQHTFNYNLFCLLFVFNSEFREKYLDL